METLFKVSGLIVPPFWALMIFLTLMLGPCGFLLYLMARHTRGHLQARENVIPVSTVTK